MGSEWTGHRLGDLVSHQKGHAFKSKDYREQGHGIVRVSDFTDRSVATDSCNYLAEELAHNYDSVALKQGDVVIATVGSWPTNPASVVGKTIRVPKEADSFLLNQNAVKLTANEALDQTFLFHLLKTETFGAYIVSAAQGSASQASITLKSIFDYRFQLPPLPEQKAIAHILGTLDDKIELNRRMNATLEGMAQALFKSWFVDFDPVIDNALAAGNPIPDELAPRARLRQGYAGQAEVRKKALESNNPSLSAEASAKAGFPASFEFNDELGWIPEGWEARAIGDSFQLLGGHSFKSGDYVEDGQFGIVTIKNVQDGKFVQECANRITEVPAKMKPHCHLKSGDVLLSLTGNVGRVCVVSEGDYLLNQRVSKIVGRDGIPDAFGYFFFRQESLYERMITIAKGTAQQNLSPIETAKLEQVMPSNQTIAALGQHLTEFHAKMVGNTAQSQTLTKLRDTLLPKLISGELRLSEAKQLIEEALI